jgi:hypothetical protein
VDLSREVTLRLRVRGERGVVGGGGGDGADDGQSEAVVVVDVGVVELAESLTPLQHAAGQGGGSETWERPGFRAREDWHGAPRTANDTYPYLISGLKLLHVATNRLNPPRYGSAGYRVFGFELAPADEAKHEWFTSHRMRFSYVYGCRMNFYQDVIVPGGRLLDVLELKNVPGPYLV